MVTILCQEVHIHWKIDVTCMTSDYINYWWSVFAKLSYSCSLLPENTKCDPSNCLAGNWNLQKTFMKKLHIKSSTWKSIITLGMWVSVGGSGCVTREVAFFNSIHRCGGFTSAWMEESRHAVIIILINWWLIGFACMDHTCLCADGKKSSPLTLHVPDCGLLIIERLCNYAMSVTMPMMDKERKSGQREQCGGAWWITERRKETPLRKMHWKEGFKDKVFCVCLSFWL